MSDSAERTSPARRARVVIGANYGDEGKGLVTDALAAQGPPALVVRANSSAQAGHTVVAGGRRHVFHHVGAGSLAGAATLLGPSFVAHPMLLGAELAALAALGARAPALWADPRASVAVPYDVLLNQAVEQRRGGGRHGSCGIGFGEAVERSLRPRFALSVGELSDAARVADRLRAIRDGWLPRRLATLRLTAADLPPEADALRGEGLIAAFAADAAAFAARVRVCPPGSLPPGRVIFENAQGLLLDEDGADFPHVTRSKTGLANVVRLAQETELEQLEVTYVTRCYLTRHGAGPLAGELPTLPAGVTDPTNRPNAFQGALRFAWLELESLAERIAADLAFRAAGITATASLAVTCLDQLEHIRYRIGDRLVTQASHARFLADLERVTGLPVTLTSRGPAREDVSPGWGAVDRAEALAVV